MKTEKRDFFNVRSMVFMAIFAALICVAAPYAIPMPGLVPISLGTFAIYLTGAMLGGKRGTVAVCVYILLGAIGLPVFTGFAGGFAKLLGPTGGYIVGYVPLVLLTGYAVKKALDYARGNGYRNRGHVRVWHGVVYDNERLAARNSAYELRCTVPYRRYDKNRAGDSHRSTSEISAQRDHARELKIGA